ncbi:hypothetical protein [Kitasatospora sp. MBT63]|uniref:hypothetical protein n=1 Tax=Kitasatospora sp. MBT63 TaxID=1444768 RepID=UPI0011EA6C68|nr:hypothetical protein [Kitasatospora sp. MBT63]
MLVEEFGVHYVFVTKRNQPDLWEACRAVPWYRVRAASRFTVRAHGRLETWIIEAVTWKDLDFPTFWSRVLPATEPATRAGLIQSPGDLESALVRGCAGGRGVG